VPMRMKTRFQARRSDRMEIALILYLIGVLWFSQTMYHEDGKVMVVVLLVMFWPLFVLWVTAFGMDEDED